MSIASEFDSITIDQLRERGSVKWTAYPDTIGAFVAEMDFGTAPAVTEAMNQTIERSLFGYLPGADSEAMSRASAGWFARNGWEVSPDRIHAIPDVLKGLEATVNIYSKPGSPIILPTPAYMPFFSFPPALGREIIEVPMLIENGRYELDLDGIDRALSQADGGVFILCNPYNPVGRVFTHDELTALCDVISRHDGVRVFSDEIHAPMVFPGHKHISYASISEAAASHTITAASASKAWNLPGLKCAQIVLSNDADAELWEKEGMLYGHGAANFGVIANTAAFDSAQGWLDEVVDYIDGNRTLLEELLAEHLPGVKYTKPEGTYITWLDWNAYDLEPSPAEFLREKAGVALTDGVMCGVPGKGFTRMIIAMPRPILEQAVRQMAEAVNSR